MDRRSPALFTRGEISHICMVGRIGSTNKSVREPAARRGEGYSLSLVFNSASRSKMNVCA